MRHAYQPQLAVRRLSSVQTDTFSFTLYYLFIRVRTYTALVQGPKNYRYCGPSIHVRRCIDSETLVA